MASKKHHPKANNSQVFKLRLATKPNPKPSHVNSSAPQDKTNESSFTLNNYRSWQTPDGVGGNYQGL